MIARKEAPRRCDLMGCPIDSYSLDEAKSEIARLMKGERSTHLVHFLNAAKIVKARRSRVLLKALWDGDLILADGKPIAPAARLLGLHVPVRIAGIDLMKQLLGICERDGHSIYLLGARQEVLERCVRNIIKRHPHIRIAGYRNGYFSQGETGDVVRQINMSNANILFVGLGTPQKELFAFENRDKLQVQVVQGSGGSFDIIAGLTKRAPAWMQEVSLEWLYRVVLEPRRLFWRYFSTNSIFIAILVKYVSTAFLRKIAYRMRPSMKPRPLAEQHRRIALKLSKDERLSTH